MKGANISPKIFINISTLTYVENERKNLTRKNWDY